VKKIFSRPSGIFYAAILLAVAVVGGELLAKGVLVWGLGISQADYEDYYAKDQRLELLTWSLKYSPHPYFGYESAAIRKFESERAGLSKQDYVIGILGGSVAELFGEYASRHPESFEPLRSALPELGGKRIVIANLGLAGGRQPQQFFIASFFLDDVDLFIGIEGFNEARIPNFLPVYPLEFPSLLMRSYERTARGRIYRWLAWPPTLAYRAMNWLPIRLPLLSRSNLYFLSWYLAAPRLHRAVESLERFYTNAVRNDGVRRKRLWGDDLLARRVQIWRRYALLQDQLINGIAGKRAFVFLQPNQYLKGTKRLSEAEKATAVDPSRYEFIDAPMQRFKREFRALNEKGIRAYDLTEIFQGIDDTVYIDFCCHINALGNEILAKAIVSRIIGALPRSDKAGSPR
jgi:hypothetical protein